MIRKDFTGYRNLFRLGRAPLWTLVTIPFLIVFSAAVNVLPPLLIGRIVDGLEEHRTSAIFRDLLIYIAVTVTLVIGALVQSYSTSIFRETLSRNLKLCLIKHVLDAQMEPLAGLTLGQVTNRIMGDASQLGGQFQIALFPVISTVCALVATIVAMISIDYRLAAVAIICSVVVLIPARLARPHIASLQAQSASASDQFMAGLTESMSISGLVALRNSAALNRKHADFSAMTSNLFKLGVSLVVVGSVASAGSILGNMIGPSGVLVLGVFLGAHGLITAGSIVSILMYQSRLSGPISTISQLQVSLAQMRVTADRILELASLAPEEDGTALLERGGIALEHVSLKRAGRKILHDVTFEISEGEHIGLVGPSGSGKSTLASLLIRLRDPDSGSISIGSVKLADISLEALRAGVCLVSQEAFIFDSSIRENILLGASEREVGMTLDEAVRIVHLSDLIARLPSGLDSMVGPRAAGLSEGERKRICLARAVIRQPSILILDEALTGVESVMERRIVADLRRAFAGRTIVLITHHLEAIDELDRVIALQDGRLTTLPVCDSPLAPTTGETA